MGPPPPPSHTHTHTTTTTTTTTQSADLPEWVLTAGIGSATAAVRGPQGLRWAVLTDDGAKEVITGRLATAVA